MFLNGTLFNTKLQSNIMKLNQYIIMVGASFTFLQMSANAAGVINVIDNGTDVVASASGSFNTAALTKTSGITGRALVLGSHPAGGLLTVGGVASSPSVDLDTYEAISGPARFGPNTGGVVFADLATGDTISMFAGLQLNLPAGYVSGTELSGTATWLGKDLATLRMTPGTYMWTWGSGATADSLTLNISVIPEPSSAALFLVGVTGAMSLRRRAGSTRS